MELAIYHRFEGLSVAEGGKQHRFSWYEWDADKKHSSFICDAMYQSGTDELHPGKGIKRGQVLRINFNEGGNCAPGNGLEIKVEDADWNGEKYQRLAEYLLNRCKKPDGELLSSRQKAAIFCQLGSLYNLLATQYGEEFSIGMRDLPAGAKLEEIKEAVDQMITSAKLKTVSAWFRGIAGDLLAEKIPEIKSLKLPEQNIQSRTPAFGWSHGIIAEQGKKLHVFPFFKISLQVSGELPRYIKITEGAYMSGDLGEKVLVAPIDPNDPGHAYMERGLGLRTRLGGEAMGRPIGPNAINSPVDPVPVIDNAKIINESLKRGHIDRDQAISALIMLASVYRLVATRYNGEFGYDPDNGQKLAPHYFDDPQEDLASQKAKLHSIKLGQGRKETSEVRFKEGKMYLRPLLISDGKSLSEYVEDRRFAKEAGQAIEVAAQVLQGQLLGNSVRASAIPVWSLDKWISDAGRIAYR